MQLRVVQLVRPSRPRLVEGSVWLQQRVPHLASCDHSESIMTSAAGTSLVGVLLARRPRPRQQQLAWQPALCIRSKCSAVHECFSQPYLAEGLLQTAIPPKLFCQGCL